MSAAGRGALLNNVGPLAGISFDFEFVPVRPFFERSGGAHFSIN